MTPFAHLGPLRIERVARRLGDDLRDVVFTGGSTLPLLVSDPLISRFRETEDVDFVLEVVSRVSYDQFQGRLRDRGFQHITDEGASVCRFRVEGILVDAMPLDPTILGFSNRWYRYGIDHAVTVETPGGLEVRHLSAAAFLATKLEAFHDRGRNDYFASHDLEDVLTVLDGRSEIVGEVLEAEALHSFLSTSVRALLEEPRFLDALPGHIEQGPVTAAREQIVLERLRQIADLEGA